MLWLADEDVDVAVARFLVSRGHDVRLVREVFGERSRDPENVAWCRANRAILLSCDRRFAYRIRQRALSEPRQCPVLLLADLSVRQLERVTALHDVILAEATVMGPAFWMSIAEQLYVVGR
jgi:predicted nuclease of predicted toxin-antitoxin system